MPSWSSPSEWDRRRPACDGSAVYDPQWELMDSEKHVVGQQQSFYEAVGGHPTFRTIVARFYALVREDEILRPLYPEDELAAAEERLLMFLEQYWGGPRTYSDQRGHPRLRMRHAPFRIGYLERDAWLRCMHTAVAELDSETLDDAHRQELLSYLETAAQSMVNTPF